MPPLAPNTATLVLAADVEEKDIVVLLLALTATKRAALLESEEANMMNGVYDTKKKGVNLFFFEIVSLMMAFFEFDLGSRLLFFHLFFCFRAFSWCRATRAKETSRHDAPNLYRTAASLTLG
jgi:hypothetical protein